jgi:hypothetical protein
MSSFLGIEGLRNSSIFHFLPFLVATSIAASIAASIAVLHDFSECAKLLGSVHYKNNRFTAEGGAWSGQEEDTKKRIPPPRLVIDRSWRGRRESQGQEKHMKNGENSACFCVVPVPISVFSAPLR